VGTDGQDGVRKVRTPAGDPAWLVTGHQLVRALLTDPRLGKSHPDPERAPRASESAIFGRPQGSPETEREDHARMRRLLGPLFSVRRMEHLRPRVQTALDTLLDELEARGAPADFHEAIAFPLPALVICELLGVPYADRDDFRRWSDEVGDTADGARSQAGLSSLFQYMRELVGRKRQHPADDVISALTAAAGQDASLSDGEVARLAAGLLFAGHATTVAAIDRGVVLLLTSPEQSETLQRDAALVGPAVEEILRSPEPFHSEREARVGGLSRYAGEDIEVGEATILAGDLVLLGLRGANQDPRVFSDPERFEITRDDNPHVAFGHGPHFCLGAPLARVELQVVFGTVLRRLPTLRLAVPVEELRARTGRLTGGLVELPVTW
jgi:pentalenolactone synthase